MRLRFAPSPTGFLHIGNARTAILNYLIAKKENATLVLRVEDTDTERSTKESEDSILHDLKWLGISWNEGPDLGGEYGPYRQSERFAIYQKYTDKLLADGNAYHCYCSQEELDAQRAEAEAAGKPFTYDGKCRNLTESQKKAFEAEGRKPTVRFRIPDNQTIEIDDLIKGKVTFNSENIGGDFIIVRSDGWPIYNYIVIIDDEEMKISHVIRGEDHLPNTPKQVLIARALGLKEPQYAHLALVMGSDRKKLSKRHGITSVDLYRKEGYLPEALVNYIAMLGWSSEDGEELFTIDELSQKIEIGSLARSAAVFDFQKLRWMNGNYIRKMDINKLTDLMLPYLTEAGYTEEKYGAESLHKCVEVLQGNCEILSDIKNWAGMVLDEVFTPDEEADTMLQTEEGKLAAKAALELIKSEINSSNFSEELINKVKEKTGLKGKNLFHPMRAIITGRMSGPDLKLIMPVIGFDSCCKRIEYAVKKYC